LVELEKLLPQAHEINLSELEGLPMKLEEQGLSITDNDFMIHMLNIMTSDYNFQLALMDNRLIDKLDHLSFDEDQRRYKSFLQKLKYENK
jgi:hypothetical protein